MALTRPQFDYIWRTAEQRDPELVSQSCNTVCQELEPQFAEALTWEKLAEFYLVPRTTEKQRGV